MKIAICYDNLSIRGGHEKVVLVLAKTLNADIYTIKYEADKTYPEFKKLKVHSNELKYDISGLRLLETIRTFRKMDLSNYDLVISNGGWSRQVAINKKNHPIIDYNPGPPGFIKYERYSGNIIKNFWFQYIKKMDLKAAEKVDYLIPNSASVKKIFEEYYKDQLISEVIYPPINLKKFKNEGSGNYYLSVQRIVRDKRIELQLEIFKNLCNENLVISGSIGDKDYFNWLLQTATKNINFVTNVNDDELVDLYSKCKGVIQTGKAEPFGIVPIEAMASGKPCIAVNEGGYKETIINRKTGLLIDPPFIDNFVKAIEKFDNYSFDPKDCQERAMEFSEEVFIEKIKEVANRVLVK